MRVLLDHVPAARVHLVDDDRDVGDALRFALELEGLAVELHNSTESLLRSDAVLDRGCLFVDQYMPGMSGLDLTRLLRTRGVTLPIVLITGRPDSGLHRRAALAGVDRVLEKPFEGSTFVEVVRKALAADIGSRS
jgi:FixJ family two-component response regulator